MLAKSKIFSGDDGWMPCKNDQEMKCFGILHVPEISNPITSGGIDGIEYLQQTIKTLSGMENLRIRLNPLRLRVSANQNEGLAVEANQRSILRHFESSNMDTHN